MFCSLAVLAEQRNPLECLDAFGATGKKSTVQQLMYFLVYIHKILILCVGIMGLQWAKHLRNSVKVTINDINEACVKMIKENCHLNHIRVEGSRTASQLDGAGDVESPIASVEVVKMDANVIMHLRPFDYM